MSKFARVRLFALLAFAVSAAMPAFAENMTVGLVGGYGIPVSPSGTGSLSYGISGAMKFNPEWDAGLRILGSSPAANTSSWLFGAMGNHWFNANLSAGLTAGLSLTSVSVSGFSGSSSAFFAGPHVAYDIPVGGGFSVAPEVEYFFLFGSTTSSSATGMVSFKYGF